MLVVQCALINTYIYIYIYIYIYFFFFWKQSGCAFIGACGQVRTNKVDSFAK